MIAQFVVCSPTAWATCPFFLRTMCIMALETIIFIFFSQSALFFFPSLFLHIHEREKLIVGFSTWKVENTPFFYNSEALHIVRSMEHIRLGWQARRISEVEKLMGLKKFLLIAGNIYIMEMEIQGFTVLWHLLNSGSHDRWWYDIKTEHSHYFLASWGSYTLSSFLHNLG
jgi:hypothetical protein